MKIQHSLIWILLLILTSSYYLGYTPLLITLIYFVASLISYYLYAKDKKAAKNDTWRVSENTLHLSALLFGWPGAIIAQLRLRHKTKKVKFRIVFWLTLIMNISLLMWIHTPQGLHKNRDIFNNLDFFMVTQLGDNEVIVVMLDLTNFRPAPF
ncbi:MAG: DUF1294 domain-containing protein [Saccharospirillaceae bacterium]|nr:DUF1294 domain-containing protein [Pseudomonadales bacterium]NRB79598.1 DUF1294 domain-containing protein [Saccharospirillaceae bacterium]